MLNSNLLPTGAALLSGFVLAFGLTACSPDKKQDAWTVDAPQISLKNGSKVGFTNGSSEAQLITTSWTPSFKEMSSHVLPPEAEIVFPSLEKDASSASGIILRVHSSCQSGPLSGVVDFSTARSSRIPLLGLIPKNILVTSLSNEKFYTCQINLVVENELGSTFSFPVDVSIANVDDTETLKLENFLDRSAIGADSMPTDVAHASQFVIASPGPVERTEVTLSCDLYAKSRTYSDLKEFHLGDLSPNFSAGDSSWRKSCRVSTRTPGQPQKVKISRVFSLSTSAPPLTVTRLPVECATLFKSVVTAFQIKNESSQNQIVGVRWDHDVDVAYGVITFDLSNSHPLTKTRRTVTLETSDEHSVTTSDGTLWVEIAAGSSTDFQIQLDQPIAADMCSQGLPKNMVILQFKNPLEMVQAGRFESLAQLSPAMNALADQSSDQSALVAHSANGLGPFQGGYSSAVISGDSTF